MIVGAFLNSSDEVTSVIWDERHGTRALWDVLIDEHGITREELGDLSVVGDLSSDTTTLLAYAWSPANPQRYAYSVIYLDRPLVSPVPEPTTGWLLTFAVALVGRRFMRGRRLDRA